jgi:nucleoside-diphosphate-sugar epimerase
MSELPHILVTGSTGNLGEKAVDELEKAGCRVTRIGLNSNRKKGVITADLTQYSESWACHFAGIDIVLHLAADPKPVATWASVQTNNVDLSLNLLRAAQIHGVKRFVFASSNWIMGGHRFTNEKIHTSTSPLPINHYGASKIFFERVGLEQASHSSMSFLSMRIGYCQRGENHPGHHMAFGRWGQEMWLSNADWRQAVKCSCLNHFNGGILVNIVSKNAGMRWDLSEAENAIGYVPTSQSIPQLGFIVKSKDLMVSIRQKLIPEMSGNPIFGKRW